ncbi:MAG: SDR family NAD(P)-dependent oxidoreductase [Nitrospira sp.]
MRRQPCGHSCDRIHRDPRSERISDLLPESAQLKGKRALIIGGSRGLGAAIAQALVSQGCSVLLNYQHSRAEAEQLRASAGDRSTQLELVQGNAADIEWCLSLRDMILTRYGGLDLLVCNASPPIRPLAFEPEKFAQFQDLPHEKSGARLRAYVHFSRLAGRSARMEHCPVLILCQRASVRLRALRDGKMCAGRFGELGRGPIPRRFGIALSDRPNF